MPARAALAMPKDAPVVARSTRAPDAATPSSTTDSCLASPLTPIPRNLHRVERPAAEPPDLLGRLRSPFLQPALILQLQQAQGNQHVTRMLAQRAGSASATPAGETAPDEADETVPEPPTAELIDRATAQEVLTQSYGAVKEIDRGKRVLLPNREALWKRCDKVFKGFKNPMNDGQPWADGDAEKYHPGMDGFAYKGIMYLNKRGFSATNTVHEMLHVNVADGFGAAVGESISEGATEYLALKALMAADIPMTGKIAYPDEVTLVTRLANLVGENTLIDGYFSGADTLIARFDALKGAGAFATLRQMAEAKDWVEAGMLVQPAPTP